jgi:hypothetical protein
VPKVIKVLNKDNKAGGAKLKFIEETVPIKKWKESEE